MPELSLLVLLPHFIMPKSLPCLFNDPASPNDRVFLITRPQVVIAEGLSPLFKILRPGQCCSLSEFLLEPWVRPGSRCCRAEAGDGSCPRPLHCRHRPDPSACFWRGSALCIRSIWGVSVPACLLSDK